MKTLIISAVACILGVNAHAVAQNNSTFGQRQQACEASYKPAEQDQNTSGVQYCEAHIGWFVGAEFGRGTTSTSRSALDGFYQNTGINAASLDVEDSGQASAFYLGYQFSQYFSVQGGYLNLGDRMVSFSGSTTDLDAYYDNAAQVYPQSGKGMNLQITLSYPLTQNLKVAGKLGYFNWEGDYATFEGAGQVGDDKIDGGDIWFGAELQYRLSDSVQLFANASQFELDRDTNRLFSVGARYFWGQSDTSSYKRPTPSALVSASSSTVVVADSDNDGVADTSDECANSNARYRVDELGCTLMLETELAHQLTIRFAHNSAEIAPAYAEKIQALIDFMQEAKIETLNIEAHTSALGSVAYNQALSERRAKALAAMLVNNYGMSASTISTNGMGETKLLDTGDTEEAHQRNRRIELNLQKVVLLPVSR